MLAQIISQKDKKGTIFISTTLYSAFGRGSSFKRVKYELTHSEARNINCNQCKYVSACVSALWLFCGLWFVNHNQVGKWGTLSPTCRKKGKLAVHRISTRLWVDFRGEEKCLFSWHSRPHPPKYIAHLWGNIDSLPCKELGGRKNQGKCATYDLAENFCSDFWSGFWSEFEQQERRQHCGSQLDGFGSGLKLRPLTGHHHHYHPDHLAYFLSLYFVVFFVLVFVFAQTAPSNRSPPPLPPWPPCLFFVFVFCCVFCACVCICTNCAL